MHIGDFDFDLPQDLIALHPARPRDSARLLVVDPASTSNEDRLVADLPRILRAGDVLVLNDTQVIHAALTATRGARDETGAPVPIEINLHRRLNASQWLAFARPGKRLRLGDQLDCGAGLIARVEAKNEGGEITLRFDRTGSALDAAIAAAGRMPLPPYIADRRGANASDAQDYQTVYAAHAGSVAAPTAGLHFTPELLASLERLGVVQAHLTLHVGAGTFLPVKTDAVKDHIMHAEWCSVPMETATKVNAAKQDGRRIIAVGTTSLRTLESMTDANGKLRDGSKETDIFITPGYRFKSADGLLTNFHLPRSTLFMLVCAFAGQGRMHDAYAHAIALRYRFYSYGDACLLWRAAG
jgi:S-adenosylmethionine:tRNA ribosyltransferase-isomerase